MAELLRDPAANSTYVDKAFSPAILLSDHFTRGFGYRVIRPNGTPNWLILYTISGVGICRIDDYVYRCEAGDIMILPTGCPHHYLTEQESTWDFHWAHFTPSIQWFTKINFPVQQHGVYTGHIYNEGRRQRLSMTFQALHRDLLEESEYREQLGLNSLELILILFAQENSRQKVDPRIDNVMKYLMEHLDKPINMKELAELVSLSPSRLSHLFKAITGDSIMDTLLRIRFRLAANLLKFTADPVSEIAEKVGFSSVYYFSQKFSGYHGMSPSAFRKQYIQKDSTESE